MARKCGRASRPNGALHTPKGEVARRHSTKAADEAPPPQSAGESARVFDAEKAWLVETLGKLGAEKPSAYVFKGVTWVCKDGRKTLGRVAMGDVLSQNVEAIERVFDLRGAITLTIDKASAPTDLLWTVSTVVPRIQRDIVLGLLRGENGDKAPSSWAYQKGNELVKQWAEQRAEQNKKLLKKKQDPLPEYKIGSAVVVAGTKRIADQFKRWESTRQAESAPPWPKSIGFDLDQTAISIQQMRGGKVLRSSNGNKTISNRIVVVVRMLGMDGGKRQPQPVLRVHPHGRSAWANVRRLFADPERFKARSARIINDRGKWLLKLSYTMPRPKRSEGQGAIVVRRGMGRFIVAQGSDGRVPLLLDRGQGSGVISIKRQMHARRGRAREHFVHQGRGARGHGKKRFWDLMSRLENAESRYVKTWCQQQAACVVGETIRMGYKEIIIEDFSGSSPPVHRDPFIQKLLRRFPFAQLRESIEWASAKAGVPTRVQALDYDASKCPECGGKLTRQSNGWCECSCGFGAWEDTVVCWHHLTSAGIETTLAIKAKKERQVKAAIEDARRAAE